METAPTSSAAIFLSDTFFPAAAVVLPSYFGSKRVFRARVWSRRKERGDRGASNPGVSEVRREPTAMGLQHSTIQKLLREAFPGTTPLVVDPAGRKKLAAEITARLERFDGVDTKESPWVPEEQKPRHVGSFSIIDPGAYYYYGGCDSFRLQLDNANRLTIQEARFSHGVLVSDLNEIVTFVQHCKQRLERKRALQAKRGKVRELLAQAILAQVRKLAKKEQFDFMSESDAQKLKLYVKLSDQHAIELNIPFREFKQVLPKLRAAIVSLRQLYQSGIRYHVVGRRVLPRRTSWITHQSLEGSSTDGDPH
jgi:hypothetical protein